MQQSGRTAIFTYDMESLSPESKRVITSPDARGPKATLILYLAMSSVPIAVAGVFIAVYLVASAPIWLAVLAAAAMGIAETAAWTFVYQGTKRAENEQRDRGELT